jgi:tripartite-type tricarboxylate transporter receptor subunit TctC
MTRLAVAAWFILTVAQIPAWAGSAAAWPDRPVRVITPAAAGGSDAVARALAGALARRWDKPVVVENRPGADGMIAAKQFLAARDGHTLLYTPPGLMTVVPLMHAAVPYDPDRDFSPISLVVDNHLALAAAPSLGATSLAGLIESARLRPGELNYTTVLGAPYLTFLALQRQAGIELAFVPYPNPLAGIPDVLTGRVHLALLPLAPLLGHARAGNLTLLAVTNPQRASAAPEIPTIAEAGYPQLTYSGMLGLFGPGDIDPALRTRIASDVRAALGDPEVVERISGLGFVPRGSTPEEFASLVAADAAKWKSFARLYGIRPAP